MKKLLTKGSSQLFAMAADLTNTVRLPKIDLSNTDRLIPGTPTWDIVRGDVFKALQEFGCFECIHPNLVPSELYMDLLEKKGLVEELFDLPVDTKKRFVDPRKSYDGYVRDIPGVPLFEFMGINGALNSPAIHNLTHLMWPNGYPKFSDALVGYSKKLQELDMMVKRMVFEEMDVEKYIESHIDSTVYSFRMNKYSVPDSDEGQIGLPAHIDKDCLTIIQQNHVNGLEVQTKDGLWFKVSPSSPPSSFIVFAGESFLAWSNGRIHCPRHHVMMTRGEIRYSIGLFSSLIGTVQCPEELVDEEHPLLFKPFNEVEMLRLYETTAQGRRDEFTLKTFSVV